MGPIFNFSCSGGARTLKVIKIQPKHLSTVLTGNDRNCTPNRMRKFWALNLVIWARFQIFLLRLYSYWRETIKIKSVGIFRVENRVIQARFSTFPPSVVPRPEKVVKTWLNIFQSYGRETIETRPQTVWTCFGCETQSSGRDFQLWPRRWYPDGKKLSKFNRNIFLPYWCETIRTASRKVWVCFTCQTESSRPRFQLLLLWWCPDLKMSSKFV